VGMGALYPPNREAPSLEAGYLAIALS
jgi:hypothetical protein